MPIAPLQSTASASSALDWGDWTVSKTPEPVACLLLTLGSHGDNPRMLGADNGKRGKKIWKLEIKTFWIWVAAEPGILAALGANSYFTFGSFQHVIVFI